MSTATRPRLHRPVAGALFALAWVAGAGLAGPPLSVEKPDKDPILTHLTNPQPSFQVVIELDRADRIYKKGDVLNAQVTSEVDGYVYVFGRGGAGDWFTLYPNDKNTDNKIKAKTPLSIPGQGYEIRIGGNLGRESIKAVVTRQPLDLKEAEDRFKKSPAFTPVKKEAKDLLVARFAQTVARQKAPTQTDPKDPLLTPTGTGTQPLPIITGQEGKEKLKEWAEASVEYTTFEKDGKPDPIPCIPLVDPSKPKPPQNPPAKFGRRIGVFIGISEYTKDAKSKVTPLQAAHKDALTFSEVAKEFFKLDEVVVLTNEQATKKNIEATIASVNQAAPNPGDFILMHWSGHGGECANTAGPGMKQYLIPHDGDLSNPDTMVMDDTFGEWVKQLSGRKVLVILDACHSGGQIANPVRGANVKGMAPIKALATPKALKPTQFMKNQTTALADMRKLMKKVDQPDAAVIASSEATEPSLERPEADLGVFTYYIIEKVKKEKGDVTPESLFEYVKVEVPKYSQALCNYKQQPNFGGGISPAPFKLRPDR